MKNIFLIFSICCFSTNLSLCQTYVKFEENGLMNNAHPYGALLCPLDKAKAVKVLNTVIDLNLPNKHINGYCEARADFICRKVAPIVYEPGCEIGKIWVFAPSIYTTMWNKTLTAPDPLFKGENINWDYHVAPLLALENGTKIDTVVIDFSIKENAYIPYKEWLEKLNCKEAIYTFTDDDYFLFYTFGGLTLTGSGHNNFKTPSNFPKIITGHFWYLSTFDSQEVPSGLAFNELAIYITDKYYSNNQYSHYKERIKNLTLLDEMSKLINNSIADLPNELVADCIEYYNERLAYWTKQNN